MYNSNNYSIRKGVQNPEVNLEGPAFTTPRELRKPGFHEIKFENNRVKPRPAPTPPGFALPNAMCWEKARAGRANSCSAEDELNSVDYDICIL